MDFRARRIGGIDLDDEPNNHAGFTPEELLRAGHKPEDEGAEKRFDERIGLFVKDGDPMPRVRHHMLWLLHNCVAHPLLAVAGKNVPPLAVEFHELTSLWLNHKPFGSGPVLPGEKQKFRHVVEFTMPKVERPFVWALHNLVAHTMIGLAPCKATFKFHDWTARLMDVPGWV